MPGIGIKLNLAMTAPQGYATCAANFGAENCIRSIATPEFGHALGFVHEEMRTDMPNFDCFMLGGALGDTYVGAWDGSSVMLTCNNRIAKTSLSSTDKLGAQAYYGTPSPASIRKDAIICDGQYAISFFGEYMNRYELALNKTESYWPQAISGIAGSWPTTSPWMTGVDAALDYSSTKIYLFSGSQYARMDKATFAVDAGYPKALPGGFASWPATWTSVHAGVSWPNGKRYLLGSEYVRLTGTTVDPGYPKPISGNWNIPYTSGFDYVMIHPNGKAYSFKGAEYIQVTVTAAGESVDAGYPKLTVGRWPGLMF